MKSGKYGYFLEAKLKSGTERTALEDGKLILSLYDKYYKTNETPKFLQKITADPDRVDGIQWDGNRVTKICFMIRPLSPYRRRKMKEEL